MTSFQALKARRATRSAIASQHDSPDEPGPASASISDTKENDAVVTSLDSMYVSTSEQLYTLPIGVDVRHTSRGRGLFTTQSVKPGM